MKRGKQAIASLGATIKDNHIHYSSEYTDTDIDNNDSSTGIYKLLTLLSPLTLVTVQQDKADLTDVFLQLTKGGRSS